MAPNLQIRVSLVKVYPTHAERREGWVDEHGWAVHPRMRDRASAGLRTECQGHPAKQRHRKANSNRHTGSIPHDGDGPGNWP